jgi:hypothetical protein
MIIGRQLDTIAISIYHCYLISYAFYIILYCTCYSIKYCKLSSSLIIFDKNSTRERNGNLSADRMGTAARALSKLLIWIIDFCPLKFFLGTLRLFLSSTLDASRFVTGIPLYRTEELPGYPTRSIFITVR